LTKYTAFFWSILDEDLSKGGPMRLQELISKILDHIVDQEDTEFEHVLSLVLSKDSRQDVSD
jgi:hypothetical protein